MIQKVGGKRMDIKQILLPECIEVSSQKDDKKSILRNIANLAKKKSNTK